ncbi:hypothetical protein ITP53_55500, partial [Nonomuraea sp. K274]|nr:hypothetical protein [Nonomuraea cypriaca]
MELDRPGRVLAALTVLPALAVAGWLLAGLPLLLLGWFAPLPAALLGLPVAALLCWAGTRRLGTVVQATPWQVAGVVAVAAASGAANLIMHAEQLVVRRDPATYAQYTAWIAGHGSLPIPTQAEAFGGPDPGLAFDSVGFYDTNGAVTPQFMPGPPMLFSIGDWFGAPFAVPPLLGALAVLTLAGVVARLAGARWAVLAALVLAVSMPILYTSRSTFSEIPSLILLFGGLSLTHDALTRSVRNSAASPGSGRGGRRPERGWGGELSAEPGGDRSLPTELGDDRSLPANPGGHHSLLANPGGDHSLSAEPGGHRSLPDEPGGGRGLPAKRGWGRSLSAGPGVGRGLAWG